MESAAAVGAEPVAVAFEEVYLSLQQGLVDGQENPISLTAENSLDEVLDYVSLSRHAVGSQLIVVSGDTWENLSEQEQKDLQNAITGVREQNRQCADEDEQSTITRWKDQGSPVIVEDVDRQAFMDRAHAYWEDNLPVDQLEVYESIRSVAESSCRTLQFHCTREDRLKRARSFAQGGFVHLGIGQAQ